MMIALASQSIPSWNRIMSWLKEWIRCVKLPHDPAKDLVNVAVLRVIITPTVDWTNRF